MGWAAVLLAFLQDIPDRPDLARKPGRWQSFPVDVRSVKIDSEGRPWFEIRSSAELQFARRQVEQGADRQSPWIAGARILLFEPSRVWLAPEAGMEILAYDWKLKHWIERKSKIPFSFGGSCFRSRAGRLYFGDRRGVHVLDGDQWS